MTALELLKERWSFEFDQPITKFRHAERISQVYLAILFEFVNPSANMTEAQANSVIITLLERVMGVLEGREKEFTDMETYALATYINSCRV